MMSELPEDRSAPDPRAPLQAGDEGGTIEQTSGSDGSNDPTQNEQQQQPR